jgi:hypothetical protein
MNRLQLSKPMFSVSAIALLVVGLSACGGGGSTNPATNNSDTPVTITLPDLQATVSGATRVVANQIYKYSATETTGTVGAYTVNWGDGTPSFSLAAASATREKIWRPAGNYTASLSRTKSDGTVETSNQSIAVVDQPISSGMQHSCSILSDNTVACWVRNSDGELGRGTRTASESTPLIVTGLTDVVALSAFGIALALQESTVLSGVGGHHQLVL